MKKRRDLLVLKAVGCGFTERTVGAVARISGPRVNQIKRRGVVPSGGSQGGSDA